MPRTARIVCRHSVVKADRAAGRVCILPQPDHHRHTRLHPEGRPQIKDTFNACNPHLCSLTASHHWDNTAKFEGVLHIWAYVLQARQGEGESTPDDILEMVKAQAAPPHRWATHESQRTGEYAHCMTWPLAAKML